MRLPNLILPGAQKSATTTLHALMSRHPEISVGRQKEPHFFSRDDLYEQGIDAYAKVYSHEGEKYMIDASQSYLPFEHVPTRMRETLGMEVRFIILLRHPVRRIESAFKHFRVKEGGEMKRSISDLYPDPSTLATMDLDELVAYEQQEVQRRIELGDIIGRYPSWTSHSFPFNYAWVSAYHTHLQHYIETFGRERFLFMGFRTMTRHQNEALRLVGEFLNIDPEPMEVDRNVNATAQRYKSEYARRLIEPAKRKIKPLLGKSVSGVLGTVERALFKQHVKIEFDSEMRAALSSIYADDMAKTSALTGVALDDF